MFRINLVPPSSGNMQYQLQCLDSYSGHNVPPLMSPILRSQKTHSNLNCTFLSQSSGERPSVRLTEI